MGNVFFSIGLSLDGFIAGLNASPTNPLGDGGLDIHRWLFLQRSFRRNLKPGDNGETGVDDKIVEEIFNRTGTNIIGMRLFEEGEANWPEDAPFHTPVFVLTHKPRGSWQRKGGTTFLFVNDGVGERIATSAASCRGKRHQNRRRCAGHSTISQCRVGRRIYDSLCTSVP